MKFLAILTTALMFVLITSVPQAGAQQAPSAGAIVDALKPAPLTRSLTGASDSGLSEQDTQFIDGLRSKTRQIVVEERKQLAKIVAKQKLPSIDLEIFFHVNSAEIATQARPSLIELGTALKDPQLAKAVILLSGHTDATGSAEHNQLLSERRAHSVKLFLIENFGVHSTQLISVGFGEEQLKNAEHPDADENRRVQIVNMVQ